MPTDDERREVARRLRHARTAHEIGEAVGVNCHGGLCNGCASEAAQLLADLIEPSCNRDALLALADELEEDACWEVQTPGNTSVARRLKDTCDRIREALGVEQ